MLPCAGLRTGQASSRVSSAQQSPSAFRRAQNVCSSRVAKSSRGLSKSLHVANSQLEEATVLVGDIGGTNARLSLWRADLNSTHAVELFAKKYPTSNHETFEMVMATFLAECKAKGKGEPQSAALAIAGAVVDNKCDMTNLSWIVDGDALAKHYGFQVDLLNDFEAVGYGIPALGPDDVITLNDAPALPKAPKVVTGPGTGLGAAQLMWDEGRQGYTVWPGEGAHATFAPRGWKQMALSMYVTALYGHCEIEQVACGSGLELIYKFLLSDEAANRPDHIVPGTEPGKKASDISAAALDASDPVALEAADMLMAIVGQEAGAMALRCLAKGGVYIAGGITPKLLPRAKKAMLEGYLMRSGREPFHKILAGTPLYVITNDKVGQIGAREVAKRLVKMGAP